MSKTIQLAEFSNISSERSSDKNYKELEDINSFKYLEENFFGLLVILKNSGKVSFSYFKNKSVNPDLIGGYLFAIQSFAVEIIPKESPVKELTFRDFIIKFEDGEYTKIALILLKNPSEPISISISRMMVDFIVRFESLYNESLQKWNGRTDLFDNADRFLHDIFI